MIRISSQICGLERTLLSDICDSSAAVAYGSLQKAIADRIDDSADSLLAFVARSGLQTKLQAVTDTLYEVDAASLIAAESQITLDLIRSQIGFMRSALLAEQNADPQAEIDAALVEVVRLARSEVNNRTFLDGSRDFQVTGQIDAQVREVSVESLGAPTSLAADQPARLFYASVDRRISADAVITLSGDFGSVMLDLTQGQSLFDAAAEINAVMATTGVQATTSENQLTLESVLRGNQASIAVAVDFGTFDVSGGNGDGVACGTDGLVSQQPSIAGAVLKTATPASLTYRGAYAQITEQASLAITGPAGSVSVSVAGGEPLTDIADQLNAYSHETGVIAQVTGNDLRLTTVSYGCKATLAIVVDQGTFHVSGGNGNGTAQGTDAIAEINGRLISDNHAANPFSVDGNRFSIDDDGNRFTIEFAANFVGPFQTITLSDAQTLKFQLSTAVGDVTTLGLPSVNPQRLGGPSGVLADLQTGGPLAVSQGDESRAVRVIDEALAQLTLIEGRIDNFADGAVATSAAFLSGLKKSIEESIDHLEKIDDAEATLLQAQNRQLSDKVLASLADLSEQRSRIMQFIDRLPGLD